MNITTALRRRASLVLSCPEAVKQAKRMLLNGPVELITWSIERDGIHTLYWAPKWRPQQ